MGNLDRLSLAAARRRMDLDVDKLQPKTATALSFYLTNTH